MRLRPALCLLLLSLAASCAQRTEAPPAPARRVVEVAGRQMRVETAGLERRRAGEPVIVFESGAGQEIDTWSDILPVIARDAPVVAYERPGMGQSQWDSVMPTPEHSTRRLRELLRTLDVPPPYVLVGHSWGAVLIRYFADRYPGDVAGLVYIDPTDLMESPDDHLQVLRSIGAPTSGLEAFESEGDAERMERIPAPNRAEVQAIRGLLARPVEQRAIPRPPSIPTAMLLSGPSWGEPPPGLQEAVDLQAFDAAWHALRVRRMRDWLPRRPEGTLVVAGKAGHFVHQDEPELVINSIRQVLARPPARP